MILREVSLLLRERDLNPLKPSLICMPKNTIAIKIRIAATKLIFMSYCMLRMPPRHCLQSVSWWHQKAASTVFAKRVSAA